jgi:hypothetical protein
MNELLEKEVLLTGGVYRAEHWSYFNEDGSINLGDDGLPLRRLVGVSEVHNKVTNQGLNYANNVTLYTTSKLSNAWYLGLFNTNTSPVSTMTYASPSFTESTTVGSRQACTFVASALYTASTLTNGSGTFTGSPITLSAGANTVACTVAGTCVVALNNGCSGTAATGTMTLTGSPVTLLPGNNTLTTTGATGNITVTITEGCGTSNSASPASFTESGTETIYGLALFGANAAGVTTAGDTSASGGVLFSAGLFTTSRSVVPTDVISATYAVVSVSST